MRFLVLTLCTSSCISVLIMCTSLLPSSDHSLRRRHFGLGLDRRCVYELDSSTPAKFSRHLTVRLPGHAFANNHAMGKFVGQVSGIVGAREELARGQLESA